MSNGHLNIISAEYGQIDVTVQITALVNRNANPQTLFVAANDGLLNETIPEQSEVLTVVYQYADCPVQIATATNGHALSITNENFRAALIEKAMEGRAVVITEAAVFCLSNVGQVWKKTSQTWALLSEFSGIQSLSSAEGTKLWYTQGACGEDNPILFSLDNGKSAVPTNGAAVQISAGRDGEAWAVTKSFTLLRWNGKTSTWEPRPGRLSQVAVASAASQWGLDSDNNILRRSSGDDLWTIVAAGPPNSPIKLLTVTENGLPIVVASNGLAYLYISDGQHWIALGDPEVRIRSLTIPSFRNAWCVKLDGVPLFIGTTKLSKTPEAPFSDEVIAEWDTESVFDEAQSTHLYIVNRAIKRASTDHNLGKFIEATFQPMMGKPPASYAFRAGMCQGLYDADFKREYNNTYTYKSHFYNYKTGRNWLYEREPTALTNGVKFFNASVAAMTASNPDPYNAGYNIGLALHYFTDMTQPMHAANFTYLNSSPVGYHTDFESYVLKVQAKLRPQPNVSDPLPPHPLDVALLFYNTAKTSQDRWAKPVIDAHDYLFWQDFPSRWQSQVLKIMPEIFEFAVEKTGQLIARWANSAKSIKISNGMRIRHAGTGATYLVMENVLRHVPNPSTYNNLFDGWATVITVPTADPYSVGQPLSSDASIIGAVDNAPPESKKTYLYTGGAKHWIVNSEVFARYGFDWNKLRKLTVQELERIPDGSPIKS